MTVGDRLRQLRTARKLTQEEVADHLGLKRPTYTRYEIGDNQADYDTLVRLADFFQTSVDYLLGRTDNPLPIHAEEPAWVRRLFQQTSMLTDEEKEKLTHVIESVLVFSGKKRPEEGRKLVEGDSTEDPFLLGLQQITRQIEEGTYANLLQDGQKRLLIETIREIRSRYEEGRTQQGPS